MNVELSLTTQQLDFIVAVLGQVPTHATMQAGMLDLIPILVRQANASRTAAELHTQ